jgi:hypothetical protein
MLPNFVYIGTPKSGSATISQILRKHPQVFTPRPKELNFFNQSREYDKGLSWYEENYFSAYSGEPIACDNSIGYASGNVGQNLSRIAADLGSDLRILITVRHPVDRAYSQYCMARYKGQFETMGFAAAVRDALAAEGTYGDEDLRCIEGRSYYSSPRDMSIFRHCMYVTPGLYADLVGRCWGIFSPAKVLVLFTEDMASDLPGTLERLTDFLGVDPISVGTNVRANEATALRYPWLRRFYNSVYSNGWVRRTVDGLSSSHRKALRRRLMSWNYRPNDRVPAAEPEGQRLLQSRYLQEILQLQEMTGRDLSHWLKKYSTVEVGAT